MKSKKTRYSVKAIGADQTRLVPESNNDRQDYLVSLPKRDDLPLLEHTTPKGKVVKYHPQHVNQCMLLMSMAEDPESWCKPERSLNISSLMSFYSPSDPYSPEMEFRISRNQRWNTRLRAAMPKAYYAYLTLRSWHLMYQEDATKDGITFRRWILNREVEASWRDSIARAYDYQVVLSVNDYETVALVERLLRTI